MRRTLPLVLLLAALPAHANLRAPRIVPAGPSSALGPDGAAVAGVRVLGETLTFACAPVADAAIDRATLPVASREVAHLCTVEARYRVAVEQAAEVALAFVLPVEQPVKVELSRGGALAVPISVEPTAPLDHDEAERARARGVPSTRLRLRRHPDAPLYQARFRAALLPGETTIAVSYRQPLGRHERDYGYFKKGRFVDELRYEVWPITEWTLAPDFRLDLAISIPRDPPGWWKRHFGKYLSIGCRGAGPDGAAPIAATRTQDAGRLLYRAALTRSSLPDVLECSAGDDDLVE